MTLNKTTSSNPIPLTLSLKAATLSALKEYEELELALLSSLQHHHVHGQPVTSSARKIEAPGDIVNLIITLDAQLQKLFDESKLTLWSMFCQHWMCNV